MTLDVTDCVGLCVVVELVVPDWLLVKVALDDCDTLGVCPCDPVLDPVGVCVALGD